MNTIQIDLEKGYHPPKVIIRENGNTIIDMPGDELVSALKAWIKHQDECKS